MSAHSDGFVFTSEASSSSSLYPDTGPLDYDFSMSRDVATVTSSSPIVATASLGIAGRFGAKPSVKASELLAKMEGQRSEIDRSQRVLKASVEKALGSMKAEYQKLIVESDERSQRKIDALEKVIDELREQSANGMGMDGTGTDDKDDLKVQQEQSVAASLAASKDNNLHVSFRQNKHDLTLLIAL
jgi:hypothetical protein